MSREKSMLQIMEAAAVIQQQISIILESKALESEKVRNWVCAYLRSEAFEEDVEAQLKQSLDIHEQMVELLEGMTKMESSLGNTLKVILQKDESGTSSSSFGGMFDFGGEDDG